MKTKENKKSRKELLLRSIKIGKIGNNFFGVTPPSAFVGRIGYPNIFAGPLISPLIDDLKIFDTPESWLVLKREDIVEIRSNLVRSNFKLKVTDAMDPTRLLLETQELAMSELPVDVEVKFIKSPKMEFNFDKITAPMGPSGIISDIEILDSPKVPKKIDSLAYDVDIKASEAAIELYRQGVSPYQISRLLSVGLLGRKRLIVPTRWSITAVDTIIGNAMLKRIKTYPEIDEVNLFISEGFGNHFEIILLPNRYSFGWTELWITENGKVEIGDLYENYNGKSSSMDGGYFAARFSTLEYLDNIKKQASIYIVREVQPTYDIPLGSWVIRELVRDAFRHDSLKFESLAETLKSVATRINIARVNTIFLNKHLFQRTISDF
ncbi:MAG TPA: hypothetical protein VEG44_05160 [Candidatus Acidoferrales bacterium]|nr:hypothetical protein [Candidatus Acidoferrales bacterium]